MDNKRWFRSKTIWFNVVVGLATAAEASFGVLQPVLPGNVYAWVAFTLAIGNAALRILTTQGIIK